MPYFVLFAKEKMIRKERQIYGFYTISDNLGVISVAHSCIPLGEGLSQLPAFS
jgi:hypothetical protein